MRKLILIMAIAFMGAHTFGQKLQPNQVPQIIKDCLQAKFPQTVDLPVSWSKEKGNYIANMTIMDTPAFMVIDTVGNTIRIERKINPNYLPKKAKDHLKALDPTYQVLSVMQITDNKDKVTYKTVAKITTNFTFDANGAIAGAK
jgi:hypothetical protein